MALLHRTVVRRRQPQPPDPRLVDDRNRVALPREARAALDVGPGDYVTFVVDEAGTVRIHKLSIAVAASKRPGGPGRAGEGQ